MDKGRVVTGVAHTADVSRVTIMGVPDQPGVAVRMFRTIADEGVNIHMIATSDISISCVIDAPEIEHVVRALHRAFPENAGTE